MSVPRRSQRIVVEHTDAERAHFRLFQHVALDHVEVVYGHDAEFVPESRRRLRALHKQMHERGEFANCDPHALDSIPVRSIKQQRRPA